MPRVLYLTYYYPPSGGSGVQRSLKMTRYLPEFGWEPVVVTVDPDFAAYPDQDPDLVADIPPNLPLIRTRSWDPYAVYARLKGKDKREVVSTGFVQDGPISRAERLARWVRGNVFLPDARVFWVPFAVRAAARVLEETPCDVVLTSGPPHSTHLAGWWLHHMHGIPWVADIRDPWTSIYYYDAIPRTRLARALDAWLERKVWREATAAVTVGEAMADHVAERSGRRPVVIRNGFDAADFAGAPPPSRPKDVCVMGFVGTFIGQQNPTALWEVWAKLRAEGQLSALRLRLTGAIDASVLHSLSAAGLREVVDVQPYLPHAAAIEAMRNAHLLLLPINRTEGAERILTGKLFEYVASGTPVLALGPEGSEVGAILQETGAGALMHWDDRDHIAAFILDLYARWERGGMERASPELTPAREALSRQAQARALAEVLQSVVRHG